MGVACAYRDGLSESNRVRFQEGFGISWIATTCVLELADSSHALLAKRLADAGIETRHWWGIGAHAHPATTAFPRTALAVTESLARSTIAVPFFRDIQPDQIRNVVDGILEATTA